MLFFRQLHNLSRISNQILVKMITTTTTSITQSAAEEAPPGAGRGHAGFWSRVKTRSLSRETRPKKGCCMSAVTYEDSMILFGGGMVESFYGDVFTINLETHVWTKLNPGYAHNVPRTLSHTAVVWKDKMLVFGGMSKESCVDTVSCLTLSGTPAWSQIHTSGDVPLPRKGHTSVVWNDRMYIFMGADFQGYSFDDVKYLDLNTNIWTDVTRSPIKGRTGHSIALHNGKGYVFGGMSKQIGSPEWLSDLWEFDLETATWKQLPQHTKGPEGRYSQISWATSTSLFIFGGDTVECTKYFNDLWHYTFATGAWSKLELPGDRPSARSGHVGSTWNGSLYMFGGEKPKTLESGQLSVGYSNSLYQLPHFVAEQTSLKSIVSRYLLANEVIPTSEEDFNRTCSVHGLPSRLRNYLNKIRPKGKPLRCSSNPSTPSRPSCGDFSLAPSEIDLNKGSINSNNYNQKYSDSSCCECFDQCCCDDDDSDFEE